MKKDKQESHNDISTEESLYAKGKYFPEVEELSTIYNPITKQYQVIMHVKEQRVIGMLQIEQKYLQFIPFEKAFGLYESRVYWSDIDSAETKILPGQSDDNLVYSLDILLYKSNKKRIVISFQAKQVSSYKDQKYPIARIRFEIMKNQFDKILIKEEQLIDLMEEIQHLVHRQCVQYQIQYKESLSNQCVQQNNVSTIPHCEILVLNLVNFIKDDIKLKNKKVVLDEEDFKNQILHAIPDKFHLYNWQRLYSSNIDGYSYPRLLKKAENCTLCIVVIQDTKNQMFGGFSNSGLIHKKGFYGDGECFVFKIPSNSSEAKIYNSTLYNSHYVWCSKQQGFGFGCGSNGYSFFINSNLENGSSYFSETFNNPILASQNQFTIKIIDIWGVEEFNNY